MTLASSELQKISSYVTTLRLTAPELASKKEIVSRAYRRFHGLLLFGLLIEKRPAAHREFARECLSDCSSSFFFTLTAFYKPGLLCLRSAIENYLRFLVSLDGTDPGTIPTVYELFAEAKSRYPTGSIERPFIDRLHTQYALLCRTSHTTKIDHMSLEVPFSRLNVHSTTKAEENLRRIDLVCTQMLNMWFSVFHQNLNEIGPDNADLTRSLVPRSLKRAISNKE